MSDTPLNNNEDGNQGEGSSSPIPEEHEKGDKEKQKSEFNLDDVDEILSRGLIDENPSEQRHPEINPRSSTLTEDPTLLGKVLFPPFKNPLTPREKYGQNIKAWPLVEKLLSSTLFIVMLFVFLPVLVHLFYSQCSTLNLVPSYSSEQLSIKF